MPPPHSMLQDNAPHILLIEDDRFFREVLARKLRESGCFVTEKDSLADARALLMDGRFRVVCFDLVMLGLPGLKQLSEIMTADGLKDAALLLLTDKELEAEAVRFAPDDAPGGKQAVRHLVKSETTPERIVSLLVWLASRPRV